MAKTQMYSNSSANRNVEKRISDLKIYLNNYGDTLAPSEYLQTEQKIQNLVNGRPENYHTEDPCF